MCTNYSCFTVIRFVNNYALLYSCMFLRSVSTIVYLNLTICTQGNKTLPAASYTDGNGFAFMCICCSHIIAMNIDTYWYISLYRFPLIPSTIVFFFHLGKIVKYGVIYRNLLVHRSDLINMVTVRLWGLSSIL